MQAFTDDELQIYRGKDYDLAPGITIHQPTLDEICDYGERAYWSMIYTLTSTSADLKFQLYDMGMDYTKISDFTLFSNLLAPSCCQSETSIITGELDLTKYELAKNEGSEEIVMYDFENDLVITEQLYLKFADILRRMHGLKRNSQLPANEATRQILIEDAREEYERQKETPYVSQLKNLVSALINCPGFKYDHTRVWDMKINAFLDSVKRISKITNATLLLQSGYSGFGINLKEIPEKQLNWLGELD
ncbi:MAG: hypothetical protein HFI69_02655 [Lachnospiraceae bacterium]|nr:hypothetical protein [Lachnospiraceae bacterium]